MGIIWNNIWLVVEPYPSEKYMSSSVGMMKFPIYGKKSKPPTSFDREFHCWDLLGSYPWKASPRKLRVEAAVTSDNRNRLNDGMFREFSQTKIFPMLEHKINPSPQKKNPLQMGDCHGLSFVVLFVNHSVSKSIAQIWLLRSLICLILSYIQSL